MATSPSLSTLRPAHPTVRGAAAGLIGLALSAATLSLLGSQAARGALPPRPVTGATATASSQAGPDTGPEHVLDGVDFRPWVSAPCNSKGNGGCGRPAQWLRITLPAPVFLRRVVILPGHSGSVARFREYARPTRVRLRFDEGAQDATLPDRLGPVTIVLAPHARTRTLTLEITATAGPPQRGVAVSAVRLSASREAARVPAEVAARIEAQVAALERPTTRAQATEALRAQGAAASPWLMAAIARGGEAGAAALGILARTDGEEARRLVWALLTSGSPASVQRASTALASSALPGLERPALRALPTAPEATRRALLGYLVRRAVPEALPALETSMRRGRAWAVILAGEHLGAYGDDGRAAASRWASDPDEALRIAGTAALRSLWPAGGGAAAATGAPGSPTTEDADRRAFLGSLVKLARGPVQAAAMDSLVSLGVSAADTLRATLSQAPPEIRRALLHRLSTSPSPRTGRLLVELVLRGGATAAWYADGVEALVKRGATGARLVLAQLQAHPRQSPRALPYLKRVAATVGDEVARLLPVAAGRPDGEPLVLTLLATTQAGHLVQAVPAVLALEASDQAPTTVRLEALRTLGFLDAPASRARVHQRVSARAAGVARVAVEASARLRGPATTQDILGFLRGRPAGEWPPDVVEMMGRLGVREVVPLLQERYVVAPVAVKLAILRAAAKLRTPGALRILYDAAGGHVRAARELAVDLLEQDG